MNIEVAGGPDAIIDPEMGPLVLQYSWRAWYTKTQCYALASRGIYMHRLIVGARRGQVVHHLNGDGLDNRRCNLHLGTQRDNLAAIGRQPTNTSGYKGVRHAGRNLAKPWIARIKYHGKTLHLGYHTTAEKAARAYDREARLLFGSTAYLNFPSG